jgi:hypothetical protein
LRSEVFEKVQNLKKVALTRWERGLQSITLGKLEHIVPRLKCRLSDIFGD